MRESTASGRGQRPLREAGNEKIGFKKHLGGSGESNDGGFGAGRCRSVARISGL